MRVENLVGELSDSFLKDRRLLFWEALHRKLDGLGQMTERPRRAPAALGLKG